MKFIIPVEISIVRNYHVDADTLDAARVLAKDRARKYVGQELRVYGHVDYTTNTFDPLLQLSEEQLQSWPYWSYGYYGTDGIDWRQYTTAEGIDSIPDYAEEKHPIPASWTY